MIPENGEISNQSSPVLATAATNAPMIDTTSARRSKVSGRGWGACRRSWRCGTVVRGGAASGSAGRPPVPAEESSAVIGSRLAHRTGTGPGHDPGGDEVHQHGDREQREAGGH